MEQCSYQLSGGWVGGKEIKKELCTHFPFTLRDSFFSLILYTHHKVLNLLGQRLLFLKFQPKVKILLKEMYQM